MSLKNLQPQSKTISTPGGDFQVGAISAEDAVRIYMLHRGLFDQMLNTASDVPRGGESHMRDLPGLFMDTPTIAYEVIAAAAGEPGEYGAGLVKQLGFPIQLEALEAVFALTFAGRSPLEFVERIISMSKATSEGLKDLQAASVEK